MSYDFTVHFRLITSYQHIRFLHLYHRFVVIYQRFLSYDPNSLIVNDNIVFKLLKRPLFVCTIQTGHNNITIALGNENSAIIMDSASSANFYHNRSITRSLDDRYYLKNTTKSIFHRRLMDLLKSLDRPMVTKKQLKI